MFYQSASFIVTANDPNFTVAPLFLFIYFFIIFLFLVSHFNFLFIPCGRLSWLPVSFLLHVKYALSYRIVFDTSG